jgi:hypothetical protein
MKQLWIIVSLTLLSCLPLSVRADSVEGKAIICDDYTRESRYRGWEFIEDGGVMQQNLSTTSTQARFRRNPDPYVRREYVDTIKWTSTSGGSEWVLDRKTLELAYTGPWGDRTTSCEVYASREEYLEAFEKYRQQEQEKLDRQMEGNQI